MIYGLSSQLRRASVSSAANLAEGRGRGGDADFARFLQMAMGSTSEAECHLLLARDLALLDAETYEALDADAQEPERMLTSLVARINQVHIIGYPKTKRRTQTAHSSQLTAII